MKRKQRRLITIDELINQQPQKGKSCTSEEIGAALLALKENPLNTEPYRVIVKPEWETVFRELAEKYPDEVSFRYLKGVAIIDDTDTGGAL